MRALRGRDTVKSLLSHPSSFFKMPFCAALGEERASVVMAVGPAGGGVVVVDSITRVVVRRERVTCDSFGTKKDP